MLQFVCARAQSVVVSCVGWSGRNDPALLSGDEKTEREVALKAMVLVCVRSLCKLVPRPLPVAWVAKSGFVCRCVLFTDC